MMRSSTTSTTELARFLSTTGPEQFTLSKEGEFTCKTSTPFFRLRSSSYSNKKKKKQLLLQQEQRNQDELINVFDTTPAAPIKARSPYRFQQQQEQEQLRQQEQRDQYYKHHHKKHIPLPVYIPPSPSPPPHPTTISASNSSSTNNINNKQRSNNNQCNTSITRTPRNDSSSSLATTKLPSASSSTSSIPMFPKPPFYTTLRTPVSSESLPSTKSSPASKEKKCPHCRRRFTPVKKELRRISCPAAIHYTPSKTTNASSTKESDDDKINSNASKEESGLTSQEAKTLLQMIEKLQHQLAQEQTSRQALEKALRNTK